LLALLMILCRLEIMVILSGLVAWRNRRETLAGFLLTLPIMVKSTCLFVLLYPLHRRAWRVLRGAGLAVLAVGLCTLADLRNALDLLRFLRGPVWLDYWDELVQSYYNCSSVTVIQRIFGETYFVDPIVPLPWLPTILVPLAPIAILILTAWAIARSESCKIHGELDHSILSLVLLTALLLPPRLAGYSLVWTLLPLASLSCAFIAHRDRLLGFLLLIGFALIQIDVHPEHAQPGIKQLLIDHSFFGLFALYLGNLRVVGWLRSSSPPQSPRTRGENSLPACGEG
ncbi:MAG: glycosyltransferase 87 family protein, partial [bacterium]